MLFLKRHSSEVAANVFDCLGMSVFDFAQLTDDDEALKDEEEEAQRLQREAAEQLQPEDFEQEPEEEASSSSDEEADTMGAKASQVLCHSHICIFKRAYVCNSVGFVQCRLCFFPVRCLVSCVLPSKSVSGLFSIYAEGWQMDLVSLNLLA